MVIKKDLQKIAVLAIAGVFAAAISHAQFFPTSLQLASDPASPSAGENYQVQAAIPAFDINGVTFRWTVNGISRSDLSGQGNSKISLTAGAVGTTDVISVVALTPDGHAYSASLNISISNLTLTWIANTTIPAWYKGKALPTPDSSVRIVALPDIVLGGVSLNPKNLIYDWSYGDQKHIYNGTGKNVFTIKTSDFPQVLNDIQVTITNANNTVRKDGRIFIPTDNTDVLFYNSTPLGGEATGIALDAYSTGQRELFDFVAEPFFFPIEDISKITYSWSVDGNGVIGETNNPQKLSVDTSGQPTGLHTVSLTVSNPALNIPSNITNSLNLELQ